MASSKKSLARKPSSGSGQSKPAKKHPEPEATTHPKPHHSFGPSSLGRRYHCPGSWGVERQVIESELREGKEESTPWADEGTYLHFIMEQLVRNDFALKGMVDSLEYGDDPSHPELIERAWNFLRSKHQETAPSAKLVAEERVHLKDYKEPTNELLFGTVDVHWVDAEAGVVYALDYKFGHQLLNDHMGGMQIYAYLAALAQWHGMRRGVGWLYLPRHDMQYKVVMEEDDYYHTIDGIKEVIEQCKAEDASLNVGDWCQYCRGNGTCGATAGSILGLEQLREALGKE